MILTRAQTLTLTLTLAQTPKDSSDQERMVQLKRLLVFLQHVDEQFRVRSMLQQSAVQEAQALREEVYALLQCVPGARTLIGLSLELGLGFGLEFVYALLQCVQGGPPHPNASP